MLKKSLAAIALATSLSTVAACASRAPQIIQMPAPKADADKPGQMTVTGQATLEVSPDCADISMTISVENPRTGSAVKDLDQKKGAMVSALEKLAVEHGDLKLSSLVLDPVYAVDARGYPTSVVRTYRAEMTITATTKDFSKIGDIMDAGATAGATTMSTQFRNSDLDQLKKKVRDMALAAAKAKADQTAGALGIKLGRVMSVNENAGGYMWGNQYFPNAAAQSAAPGGTAIGGALQPLTLDVTVGYSLPEA